MHYKSQRFGVTDLKGEDFRNCVFTDCQFACDLKFTSFVGCTFKECDFSSVVFEATSFMQCQFPHTNLSNLNFSPVQFKHCDFSDVIMKNSVMQQFKSSAPDERKKVNLQKVIFDQADLSGMVFSHCELEESTFLQANLENATFDHCDLARADLSGANISGTNFTTSVIDWTTLDLQGFLTYGASKGFVMGG